MMLRLDELMRFLFKHCVTLNLKLTVTLTLSKKRLEDGGMYSYNYLHNNAHLSLCFIFKLILRVCDILTRDPTNSKRTIYNVDCIGLAEIFCTVKIALLYRVDKLKNRHGKLEKF